MSISKTALKAKLQTAIDDYAFGSSSVSTIISQAVSVSLMGEPNIVTVGSIDLLPNLELYDTTDAVLCFITNLGIFAISSNKKWLTLDGKTLRNDSGLDYQILYGWGTNNVGNIGDGTNSDKSSPVSVIGGLTDWCQIATGCSHSLGVKTNGTAWAWGGNYCGQLGNNSLTACRSPTSVIGGFNDWCQLGGGENHSFGLRTNGTIWAWGRNDCGQLGDNTTISRSSPVSVVGGCTNWCQVSAGWYHNLALQTNGTLWAWGNGASGRLGDNTANIAKSSPVSVVGGFTDWCRISAGGIHNLAQKTDGTLWAWGFNLCGNLGDNTTISRSSPVSVVGGFTDWCQFSAGRCHNHAIRTNGTLWSWGTGDAGRLGINSSYRSSPSCILGGFTDWCYVSAGNLHGLGIRTNGSAWAWGCTANGRLGNNLVFLSCNSPVSVVGGFTDWHQVSAGGNHSIGLRRRV